MDLASGVAELPEQECAVDHGVHTPCLILTSPRDVLRKLLFLQEAKSSQPEFICLLLRQVLTY